jgi:hypothetical protein
VPDASIDACSAFAHVPGVCAVKLNRSVASSPTFHAADAIADPPGAATRTAYTVDAPPANTCSSVRVSVRLGVVAPGSQRS